MTPAGSGKGRTWPAEARWLRDDATGARIRQVTAHPSIHHHPFFFVPPYDDAMRRLVFVSHRTGRPQLFAEEQASGRLVQLTDRDDLAEWSFHPSRDGRHVFFVAGTGAWRLDLETLAEERLADFGDAEMRERGMVGAAMGTTTVSRDDRWWAVPVKVGKVSRVVVIDSASGASRVIQRIAPLSTSIARMPFGQSTNASSRRPVSQLSCVSHWSRYSRCQSRRLPVPSRLTSQRRSVSGPA